MEWLFVTLGDLWGHQSAAQHRWLGLALYGMDGSTLRVADSKEMLATSGTPRAGAAKEANVEPTRISFIAMMRFIADEWLWHAFAGPGAISQRLSHLRAAIYILILPPRRSKRRYPWEVKIKMSNYRCKRRSPTRKRVR
jgi:hypothetical protein